MPIAINCLQGRNRLPQRTWKLPLAVGWVVDTVCRSLLLLGHVMLIEMQIALSYIALTTVLFLFPPSRSVTGSNMSESSAHLSL